MYYEAVPGTVVDIVVEVAVIVRFVDTVCVALMVVLTGDALIVPVAVIFDVVFTVLVITLPDNVMPTNHDIK